MNLYEKKYIKYKSKYIQLKQNTYRGGYSLETEIEKYIINILLNNINPLDTKNKENVKTILRKIYSDPKVKESFIKLYNSLIEKFIPEEYKLKFTIWKDISEIDKSQLFLGSSNFNKMGKLLLKPIKLVGNVYFTNIQILEYIINYIVKFIESQIEIDNKPIHDILKLIYHDATVKEAFENLYESFFTTGQQNIIKKLINKILTLSK
uniref:Uncharacterized protein n=1 Tax=viral metagenome TaxID=1070528 RepID=A0A6C0H851_9ZZZZ